MILKGKVRIKKISHLLVHFTNTCNSQSWRRWNQDTRIHYNSSTWVAKHIYLSSHLLCPRMCFCTEGWLCEQSWELTPGIPWRRVGVTRSSLALCQMPLSRSLNILIGDRCQLDHLMTFDFVLSSTSHMNELGINFLWIIICHFNYDGLKNFNSKFLAEGWS